MDIKCVVCGEPWDSYGVRHGDMLPWQADLFRRGAGCPTCEGVDSGWQPETLSDIDNGDEDPMVRIILSENKPDRPPWKRPDDATVWECEACDVVVRIDIDDGERYASGRDGWRLEREDPDLEPIDVAGHKVCACCVTYCDDCGKALCDSLSHDTYDGLASLYDSGSETTRCIDCYEDHDFGQESWEAWGRHDVVRQIENGVWEAGCDVDVSDYADRCAELIRAYMTRNDGEDADLSWIRHATPQIDRAICLAVDAWRRRSADPRRSVSSVTRRLRKIVDASTDRL